MDNDTLKNIPDGKPVRIFLPLTDSTKKFRANCIYQSTDDLPHFQLLFKPGALPYESLDTKQSCIISIDIGGPTVSLEAMITEIINPQTLTMVARKTINHEQMREFFRVDATTTVISRSFHPTVSGNDEYSWKIPGNTIDISGSGLLASFSEEPPDDKQVRLDITLPTDDETTVSVLATPIRIHKIHDNQWEVAYHFEDISMEDRDLIIGSCLNIQRQLLRLKVQVKD